LVSIFAVIYMGKAKEMAESAKKAMNDSVKNLSESEKKALLHAAKEEAQVYSFNVVEYTR